MEKPDDMIISKKQGYTAEEKARVLGYAAEHSVQEAVEYFKVSDVSIFKWRKELCEPVGYKKLTAEDVPDVPGNDIGEIAEALPERSYREQVVGKADSYPTGTWDDWDKDVAAQLRERIGELERQAERYRRALGILEGV